MPGMDVIEAPFRSAVERSAADGAHMLSGAAILAIVRAIELAVGQ
jgi:hypothetical protein